MNIEVDIEAILKTSDEWQRLNMDIIVLDPIGWDRKNYEYSWFQEILTEEQYTAKCMRSTCIKYND